MLYQCSCGRTISISTYTFITSSASSLNAACLEGTGYDQADPFAGSYLETGDRILDIIEEDEEEDDDILTTPERDFSIYTESSLEFEE